LDVAIPPMANAPKFKRIKTIEREIISIRYVPKKGSVRVKYFVFFCRFDF
jgi:hypothetical protein